MDLVLRNIISVTNQEQAIRELIELNLMEMEPGEVVACNLTENSKLKLYISCPRCGDASFTGEHAVTNKSGIFTVRPSIITSCCGWHGYLTDNKFIGQ